MKQLILISFLFISTGIYSQGNLQFNRVINLEYKQNLSPISSFNLNPGETTLETFVIPENKVWKIIKASVHLLDTTRNDSPYNLSSNIGIFINNTNIYSTYGAAGNTIENKYPIWIGSGQRNIIAYNANANSNTIKYMVSISIIEFNIVQ